MKYGLKLNVTYLYYFDNNHEWYLFTKSELYFKIKVVIFGSGCCI